MGAALKPLRATDRVAVSCDDVPERPAITMSGWAAALPEDRMVKQSFLAFGMIALATVSQPTVGGAQPPQGGTNAIVVRTARVDGLTLAPK